MSNDDTLTFSKPDPKAVRHEIIETLLRRVRRGESPTDLIDIAAALGSELAALNARLPARA